MMKKKIVVLMLMASLAMVAQAELLSNTGFEAGTYGAKLNPTNWAIGGYYSSSIITSGQHNWNSVGGVGGGQCMLLKARSYTTATTGTAGGVSTVQVDVFLGQELTSLTEGAEYSFSAWTKQAGSEGSGATPYAYYTWWDAAHTGWGLGYGWLTGDITVDDTWQEVDFGTLIAPAGAVDISIYLAGSSTKGILFDDASFVPEPVTLSLLGLGALMLRRKK
jgi:hypothetical protein